MKARTSLLIFAALATALPAAPEFRGPLPQEQRELIQSLAEHHAELRREVTMTANGYTATTTTADKELAEKLKQHVDYMKRRLGSGAMVRRWDPAFAEMVDHYGDLETKVEVLENGIKVTVTGKTPQAVKVAQNHARVVTSFTKEGSKSVQREHPATTDLGKDAGQAK